MLVRLLLGGLRPYRRDVTLVLALLLGVAVSNLYLPNLTADIINNGVVKATSATSGAPAPRCSSSRCWSPCCR